MRARRSNPGTSETSRRQGTVFVGGGTVSFEAQDPDVDRSVEAAAATQHAGQGSRVISDEERRAAAQTALDCLFNRVGGIRSSREPGPAPSARALVTLSWASSPAADGPAALPPPVSPACPVSNPAGLFTGCPPCANCCTNSCSFIGPVL